MHYNDYCYDFSFAVHCQRSLGRCWTALNIHLVWLSFSSIQPIYAVADVLAQVWAIILCGFIQILFSFSTKSDFNLFILFYEQTFIKFSSAENMLQTGYIILKRRQFIFVLFFKIVKNMQSSIVNKWIVKRKKNAKHILLNWNWNYDYTLYWWVHESINNERDTLGPFA